MATFPTSLQFSLLVTVLLVGSATAERKCPLGEFCRIGANCSGDSSQCVETCPTDSDRSQQGNWSTGNCERGKDVYRSVHHVIDNIYLRTGIYYL